MEQVLWPGWETVGLIGRGSFGAVYEIRRDMFGEVEKAALKVISIPQNAGDIAEMRGDGYDRETITETFKNHMKSIVGEYSMMRRMNGSAHVVSCDDVRCIQHDDGIGWDIYIKMELLKPLMTTLPQNYDENLVVWLAEDMCSALVLCQNHGIIHRDIKPQNIFLSHNGDYKLGDFGVSKTVEKTMGGTKIGTYKYMAPEVYNNQPYGVGADIYSLGLVLYWMMNERRMPFLPLPPALVRAGEEERSRALRFSGTPIPAPAHGSPELKRIVLKACAFDPRDRYQNAREMLEDLQDLIIRDRMHVSRQSVQSVPKTAAPARPPEQEDDRPTEHPDPADFSDATVGLFGPRANSSLDAVIKEEEERLRKEQQEREEAERRAKAEAARAEAQRKAQEEAEHRREEEIRLIREAAERKKREVVQRLLQEQKAQEGAVIRTQETREPASPPLRPDTPFKKNPNRKWIALICTCVVILGVFAVILVGILPKTGWQTIDGKTYYYNDEGVMQTGWQIINGNTYYFGTFGRMYFGWQTIDGSQYYFGENGIMRIGWQTIDGSQYYFGKNGIMRIGWQTIGVFHHYFDKDGIMQTGWQTIDGSQYYFGKNGIMRIGWQTIGGNRYYFNKIGIMQIGWTRINGEKYYFNKRGVMQTGTVQIGGKIYQFAADGKLIS